MVAVSLRAVVVVAHLATELFALPPYNSCSELNACRDAVTPRLHAVYTIELRTPVLTERKKTVNCTSIKSDKISVITTRGAAYVLIDV